MNTASIAYRINSCQQQINSGARVSSSKLLKLSSSQWRAFSSHSYVIQDYIHTLHRLIQVYLTIVFAILNCSSIDESFSLSMTFLCSNGIRQGAQLSPLLYKVYTDDLNHHLQATGVGCYVGGAWINSMSYADDMVLLAPTVTALPTVLEVCRAPWSSISWTSW